MIARPPTTRSAVSKVMPISQSQVRSLTSFALRALLRSPGTRPSNAKDQKHDHGITLIRQNSKSVNRKGHSLEDSAGDDQLAERLLPEPESGQGVHQQELGGLGPGWVCPENRDWDDQQQEGVIPGDWREEQHASHGRAKGMIELPPSLRPSHAPDYGTTHRSPGEQDPGPSRCCAAPEGLDVFFQGGRVEQLDPEPHRRGVEPRGAEFFKARNHVMEVGWVHIRTEYRGSQPGEEDECESSSGKGRPLPAHEEVEKEKAGKQLDGRCRSH